MSANAAVWPETYATASSPSVAVGTTSSETVDESLRLDVLRRRVRRDADDRDALRVVELRLARGRDTLEPLHAVEDLLQCLGVAVDVDDDRDRAVEARPEALGEQVVRAPRRLLGRLRPLIRRAETDERRRRCQQHAEDEQRPEHRLRMSGHLPTPTSDRRSFAGSLRVVQLCRNGTFSRSTL